MWEITVTHEGLKKYRVIKSQDERVVDEKARLQLELWDEQWEKKLEAEARRQEREVEREEKGEKKALALERTQEAQLALNALEKILDHTLEIDDAIDWDALKDQGDFPEPRPAPPSKPRIKEPKPTDEGFQPYYHIWEYLLPWLKKRKRNEAAGLYEWAKKSWNTEQENYRNYLTKHDDELREWEQERAQFKEDQANLNSALEETKRRYLKKDNYAIEEYCDLVLSNSQYPELFPKQFEIEYNGETGILVVEYILPDVGDLPNIKEVKYIQSRNELEEKYLSDAASSKLYDSVVYQISLRTIHEIFEADVINSITSVVFNGWVNYIDKSTGKDTSACIMSLQASKEEFLEINLRHVESKACFKALKGVGSTKLHSMAPIAPILQISREDSRFVQSIEVIDRLEEETNLAVIDWQDFEHLIREVFEKEFSAGGGEVKVTQASRDGGVDAVAFDPDPIRGGKIIIQAKRYTNVVGVAAVRDLYGTVVNEGATKGILVTTSNYGPDAYDFAKGKPITLLNGANLLHLLSKHGHKARINIQEAKMLAKENEG